MSRINNNKQTHNNPNNRIKKSSKVNNSNIQYKNIEKTKRKDASRMIKKKKTKKKKSIMRAILKFIFFLMLIIGILAGIFYYKVQQNGGGIKGALITAFGLSLEEVNNLQTINVLVLGVSEDIETLLTDTIIVCSYNPENNKASMISIPRDTFIGKNKNNAKATDKINSLYSKNPEKLLDKVSNIIGIKLDYYVVVNTNTLVQIVDIIGGVDFEVPINMDYDDNTQDLHIHLKKGMQRIDGMRAEQLLRFRHNNDGSSYPANYGDNDYGRMKTQREFMIEALKQSICIKNITKAKTIVNTIFDNIQTNLTIDDLLKYTPTAVEFNFDSIVSIQLPGQSEKCNELWFYVYNEKETEEMIAKLELK